MRRGILQAFDSGSYLATVAMAGSFSVWLEDVPVSRAIATGEMIAGRNVAVLLFDASNPDDAVICAVWTA